MDILIILNESANEILPEDLDFFETELATGDGYDEAYIAQCRQRITELRTWLAGNSEDNPSGKEPATSKKAPGKLVMGVEALAPKELNPAAADLTPEKIILRDIAAMREDSSYKSQFKKYVASKDEIDAAFVETHFSFFKQWELDAIISVKQMPEEFLEKYFGTLDKAKIARYQQFSESFFMKHYQQLDAEIVLLYGKNPWRKKGNRSRQLDVFLRLKGVKI
ncbi:MAG: hypothetical protein IK064_00145 [Clostridia bacterium]|nr:hypothetical protein [Clostridia bacterium]